VADNIADARFVEVPGSDDFMWAGDPDAVLEEIQEFLTGVRPAPEPDRVLATVLFTDIVGSTEEAARRGDRGWRDLLDQHHALVRRELERFRGREIDTSGDGFLATFDGPARAIRCAGAISAGVRSLGLEVRAGLHTGEVELVGSDVAGIAVHIGARVAALAGAGEVLVSSTVKDLVAGSGIEFEDRGVHALKGVPGEWRLFAVEESEP
jgi:class 3 adenylate cyclase